MNLDALLDDIVAANRILFRNGVVDAFGHISARHPDRPDHFSAGPQHGAGECHAR